MKTANDNQASVRQCIDMLHQSNLFAIERLEALEGIDHLKLSEARYYCMLVHELMLQALSNVSVGG